MMVYGTGRMSRESSNATIAVHERASFLRATDPIRPVRGQEPCGQGERRATTNNVARRGGTERGLEGHLSVHNGGGPPPSELAGPGDG